VVYGTRVGAWEHYIGAEYRGAGVSLISPAGQSSLAAGPKPGTRPRRRIFVGRGLDLGRPWPASVLACLWCTARLSADSVPFMMRNTDDHVSPIFPVFRALMQDLAVRFPRPLGE
jgi:hypothetical protein